MAPTSKDPSPLRDLITANHILHNHQILDAYGHISLRNPDNPDTFFLSHSIAPALVSSPSDIVEYNIKDASPVQEGVSEGYKERCIHSEVLKAYPGVNSVIHSHSEAVLPYGISGVEMKPCFHFAGFLGPYVPTFNIASHYTPPHPHNLLVTNRRLGAALATYFTTNPSFSPYSTQTQPQPTRPVVLMRGHGFTTVGANLQEAVFRAVYTQQNARVQTEAMALRDLHMRAKERLGVVYKNCDDEMGIQYLGKDEMEACTAMGQETMGRPWGLWVREVEANALYVNEA